MKRRCSASASEQAKRRKVKHEIYRKRVTQFERECQTVTWLDCETEVEGGVKLVTKLKCRVYTKYRDRIVGTPHTPRGQASHADDAPASDTNSSEEEEEKEKLLLDDWDNWMQDN